jgi:dTDP-4-dehydrorhamnose 3,5-epimerase
MNLLTFDIPGLLLIEPKVFGDPRGFFFELWNQRRFADIGIKTEFVQDNISMSQRNTLRGLHFQNPNSQAKLVTVLEGEVFDVAVDLRRSSPTFGCAHGLKLSRDNKRQFYIPAGFAHGFLVLSDTVLFHYKCTTFYSPKDEITIAWDDPDLKIDWGITNPILSEKDRHGLRLRDIPADRLFQ